MDCDLLFSEGGIEWAVNVSAPNQVGDLLEVTRELSSSLGSADAGEVDQRPIIHQVHCCLTAWGERQTRLNDEVKELHLLSCDMIK